MALGRNPSLASTARITAQLNTLTSLFEPMAQAVGFITENSTWRLLGYPSTRVDGSNNSATKHTNYFEPTAQAVGFIAANSAWRLVFG